MDQYDHSIPWLLMILKPGLPRTWLDEDPGHRLTVNGQSFDAWGEGDIGGFLDRVYDASGKLSGIQFTPSPAIELLARLTESESIRLVDDDQRIQLFWARNPVGSLAITPDQAFGGRMYEGTFGDLAVCFDTEFFETHELEELQRLLPTSVETLSRAD